MEARIKASYFDYQKQHSFVDKDGWFPIYDDLIPSRKHLDAVRLLRSQIYALEPRPTCSYCKVKLAEEDDWFTKNQHPDAAIYCSNCLSDDKFTVQKMGPHALRRWRVYQAIHLGRQVTLTPDGPSFRLNVVPKGVEPTTYKTPDSGPRMQGEFSESKERLVAFQDKMRKIGPDTLPPLEKMDRRQAYLESKEYKMDPAYLPSKTVIDDDRTYQLEARSKLRDLLSDLRITFTLPLENGGSQKYMRFVCSKCDHLYSVAVNDKMRMECPKCQSYGMAAIYTNDPPLGRDSWGRKIQPETKCRTCGCKVYQVPYRSNLCTSCTNEGEEICHRCCTLPISDKSLSTQFCEQCETALITRTRNLESASALLDE